MYTTTTRLAFTGLWVRLTHSVCQAIPSLQNHRDWIKERNHEAMDVALQAAKDRHVVDAAAYRCLSAALDLCLAPEERRRFRCGAGSEILLAMSCALILLCGLR